MKNTRWILTGLLLSFLLLQSCNSDTTTVVGNWVYIGDFAGRARSGPFSFTIDNKVYIGLGLVTAGGTYYADDSYKYDYTAGTYTKIAPFPGTLRELPVSFAFNGKGYVGLGYNHTFVSSERYFNDFWEYDPSANTWTQIDDFPSDARYGSTAIVAGDAAYVGFGTNGNAFYDVYKFSADKTWSLFTSPRAPKRAGAMTFTINGKIYLFGGDSDNGTTADFYEFDPNGTTQATIWLSRTQPTTNANYNDFVAAVHRSYGGAFSIGDFGYVTCGSISGGGIATTYQYNPSTDTWVKMTSYEGSVARSQGITFVITDEAGAVHACYGMGGNGNTKYGDNWEWKPTDAYVAGPL